MSTIDPTTAATTGASATKSSTTTNPGLSVNENQFLQLMVKQLQYQDPLNPSSPTDFMSQLAQMTSVEQETNTASNTQSSEMFGLLGHTATYSASDGSVASGQVTSVDLTSTGGATLTIGGVEGIKSSAVTGVS